MTGSPAPGTGGPRTLSAVLRELDGSSVEGPGGVDLAAAVSAGNRRRRRRRASGGAIALVAAGAVLGLGATLVGGGTAGPSVASSAQQTGHILEDDPSQLQARGFTELPPQQLITPGVADDRRTPVSVDSSGTSVVVFVDGDGCSGNGVLTVDSQDSTRLHLSYTEPEVPADTACAAFSVTIPYEVDLASPLDPQAKVVLDLPWARADSAADVPGIEIGDLDPGEVEVAFEQLRLPEGRSMAEGIPMDHVFVDAAGTRVRLRFAFSFCATAVLRPPRENDQQVYLDVVTPSATIPCTDRLHAEDLVVTLDAPLGDRQVIISEESRIP